MSHRYCVYECPCPLKLEEKMKELEKGQILAIMTDYDGALEDIRDGVKDGTSFGN